MAPMKFEEQLKEKLEERRLQPSEAAWNKLSGQLDAQDANTNRKAYWWVGIAASIVGVLLLVTYFNIDQTIETPDEIIVDTEKPSNTTEDNTNNQILIADQEEPKEEIKEETPARTKEKESADQPILKQRLEKEQKKLILDNIKEVVAEVDENKTPPTETVSKLSFEEQKAKEVVAQIKALQEEQEVVTDAEIDALLKAAHKEIELKNLYNEATNKVDANALLQSVEDDLERSFRTRVFEMLQSGYRELKTAVAERNN